jgi:ribosomal protein L11 methylase PrmA
MLSRAPNIEVKVLEQVYNALVESRMMTGAEIWGVEDGWKEVKEVHELFCKRVMGTPNTAANGACVKELGRANRKEKVIERVLRYWQRLREMDEMSSLGDALKQQRLEKGKNWLNKIKQELEGLGMGDIWIKGEENNRNVWREVIKGAWILRDRIWKPV